MKTFPTSNDGRQKSLYDFNPKPDYSVPAEQSKLTPPVIQDPKPASIEPSKGLESSIVIEVDRDEYPSEDNPMGREGEWLNKNSRMLG